MAKLDTYLSSMLGIKVTTPKDKSDNLERCLSSSYKKSYNFSEILLQGISVIVAEPKIEEKKAVTKQIAEYKEMRKYFHFPILLELHLVDSRGRRQFIGEKVNFVVPGHQLYFPELFISLREDDSNFKVKPKMLSVPAQVLLLYHLQKKSLAQIPFREIASLLGYSAKTISLSVAELANFGIAKVVETDGHAKHLHFPLNGLDLYNEAEKLLRSPVAQSGYTNVSISENVPRSSTFYFLYGRINGVTYCMTSKQAKELGIKLYASQKNNHVEIWKYDPNLMASDGFVDLLSFLLSTIRKYESGYTDTSAYDKYKKMLIDRIVWAK